MRDLWNHIRGIMRSVAGAGVALLPRRYWSSVDLPVERGALISALATVVLAASIGGPAFLRYSTAQADRATELMLQATGWRPAASGVSAAASERRAVASWWSSYLSFFAFAFFTPAGLLTTYLGLTGAVRAIAFAAEDPFGDPVLTGLDAVRVRMARRAGAYRARRSRERLEGPDMPDRVLPGIAAGFPDADCVIVACRRKEGWDRGVFVITGEKWYRLGTPVERRSPGGLRTLYPLTELRDREVLRRSVRYEIPVSRDES